MKDLLSYDGRRTLVFGGGGAGMGAAVVRDLVGLGAEVHVVDLREPPVAVAGYQQADLREPSAIEQVIAAVGPPLHSLFYCAGLPGPPFDPIEVMTVNFLALRHAAQAAETVLTEGAAISAISSGAGMGWMMHLQPILELLATPDVDEGQAWCKAHPELVDQGYAFSKEAIIVWVMAACVGLGERKRIRLNCISPGPTDTPMMPQFVANSGEDFFAALPRPLLGRNATPDEQAHPMVFLNSDAASCITGANLYTDGGFSGGIFTGQVQLPGITRAQ
ncbi:MAG TPA: SDR family oxidoreductase [Acidimicrobiales bacterium]|nr:SDR family oxidoreductase [Acidimicrobiales bacterium]